MFLKWMEMMFNEFFKQGDMERSLEIQISKFMEKQLNTNKEKVYVNYIEVICAPLLTTLMLLVQEEEIS